MVGYGQNLEPQGLARKILRNKGLHLGFRFSTSLSSKSPPTLQVDCHSVYRFEAFPNGVLLAALSTVLVLKSSVKVVRHILKLRKTR